MLATSIVDFSIMMIGLGRLIGSWTNMTTRFSRRLYRIEVKKTSWLNNGMMAYYMHTPTGLANTKISRLCDEQAGA